jgi:uncharacterized protein (TIRG00374 family)
MTLRSIGVALLAFALLALFLNGVDLREVWRNVQSADPLLVAVAIVFAMLTYVARSVRWKYLLEPVGHARLRTAFRTTIIGFAALSLLPLRIGDPLRSFLLARKEGLSQPATLATVIAERVLDAMAVVVLLAVYVWGFADPAVRTLEEFATLKVSALGAAAAAVAGVATMWLLGTHPERVGAIVRLAAHVAPHRTVDVVARFATRLSHGFAAARSPRLLVLSILWSFSVWLVIATEAWLVTRAFGLELSFPGIFLVQTFLVLGVSVGTPAGVGAYHFAYQFSMMKFFGAPESDATAAAIVLHAISFGPVVLLGILYMVQDGLSLGGLRRLADEGVQQQEGAAGRR